MGKSQNIKKRQCNPVDIIGFQVYAKFGPNQTPQWLKKPVAVENFLCILPIFPIQMAKIARVVPNFVASYLGNRRELRDK